MNTGSPITAIADAASAAGPIAAPTDAERELVRQVSKAVSQLNDTGTAGQGKEITFSIDRATRLPVVKVVDTNTKEVIRQWPTEYVLQLAADNIKGAKGARDSG